jgi:hypothetical protein
MFPGQDLSLGRGGGVVRKAIVVFELLIRRVQNNTRSVNKATQRTTMKRSFYWHEFFIKYVVTVIVRDEVVNKAWLDV